MAGYTFDWTKTPPETDDPAWAGKLWAGEHNAVLVDGAEVVGEVRRFCTGRPGWVEVIAMSEAGTPQTEIYELATGAVPMPPPRWQSKVQQPDGTWQDKYGERLKVHVLRGDVEYVSRSDSQPLVAVTA